MNLLIRRYGGVLDFLVIPVMFSTLDSFLWISYLWSPIHILKFSFTCQPMMRTLFIGWRIRRITVVWTCSWWEHFGRWLKQNCSDASGGLRGCTKSASFRIRHCWVAVFLIFPEPRLFFWESEYWNMEPRVLSLWCSVDTKRLLDTTWSFRARGYRLGSASWQYSFLCFIWYYWLFLL